MNVGVSSSQQRKKERERFYAEKAAELLGRSWTFGEDREHPDFIVAEGTRRFSLELSDIFSGTQGTKGSHRKAAETETQRAINSLRGAFEAATNKMPLTVKLVGDMCAANLENVVPGLAVLDIPSKPVGYQEKFVIDEGPGSLTVYVTRALRPDWFCVNDRAGGVHLNPVERIAEEIAKKAEKLSRYRESSGLDDMRLLLVANRIMNSGKLKLEGLPSLALHGFSAVYFLSYPETATELRGIGDPVECLGS